MNTSQPDGKKKFYKKWWFWITVLFVVVIVGSSTDNTDQQATTTTVPVQQNAKTETQQPAQSSQTDKATAQKEFDDLMTLGKKSGLVVSYDFPGSDLTIYTGNVWYSQTVAFKKDFIAKISTLKETISGYHRLEVRDAYSNEKLAEITAFSGSLEVYK